MWATVQEGGGGGDVQDRLDVNVFVYLQLPCT